MAMPGDVRRAFRGLHPGDVDRRLIALAEQVQRVESQNDVLRHELASARAAWARADAGRKAAESRSTAARLRRAWAVVRARLARRLT